MEIGPSLPPHLRKKVISSNEEENIKDEREFETTRPPKERSDISDERQFVKRNQTEMDAGGDASYGPSLPPAKSRKNIPAPRLENKPDSDSDEEETYGPALPPGFQKKNEHVPSARVMGPVRPQIMTIEPRVAGHSDNDDDDTDMIGPMPPVSSDTGLGFERTKLDIEARSQATKDQMTGKNEAKPKRETWMTELPPDLSKNFGLGPRKFRNRAVELGDQSVWTDTPSDKAKQAKEGEKSSKRSVEEGPKRTPWELERDQQMGGQVDHYNKRHRGESLMDMHKKKIDKEKKEEKDKPVERRPFDRDKDLGLPGMSAVQKKSVIQKSKELGNRFHNAKSGSSYL